MRLAIDLIDVWMVFTCAMAAAVVGAAVYWLSVRIRAGVRRMARLRVPRALRELETGTCDGLDARTTRRLVHEMWIIDRPTRRN